MSVSIRAALAALSVLLSAGCASTDPLDGAAITYRMPRTDAVVKLAVTINECTDKGYDVTSELTLVAKPGVLAGKSWSVNGGELASFRIKRSLQINVTEDGVLSSVNTTNADQTPAIIESVGKLAGTLLALAPAVKAPDAPKKPSCIDDGFPTIKPAIMRARALRDQIEALRKQIIESPATPDEQSKRIKAVNLLAKELATLREGFLKVETEGAIKLDGPFPIPAVASPAPPAPEVNFDIDAFARWFDDTADANRRKALVMKHFKLEWSATVDRTAPAGLTRRNEDAASKPRNCDLALPVPKITHVAVAVKGVGGSLKSSALEAKKTLPLAQLAGPAELCLDVGFGESRTVGLKFDRFGQVTEFNFASEATGAAVAASLAGTATNASGILTTLRGPSDLDKQKSEIDRLVTQQTLNKLLACQAILDAGGFDCEQE